MLGWASSGPRMWVWVVSELVSSGPETTLLRQGAKPAILNPCLLGQLSHAQIKGWSESPHTMGETSSPAAVFSKEQEKLSQSYWRQLNMTLRFQYTWFLWSPVITRAMNINTDPKWNKNMDPDTSLNSSLGPVVTIAPGSSTGHPYHYGPSNSVVLSTNLSPGGSPPGICHGSWWYQEP